MPRICYDFVPEMRKFGFSTEFKTIGCSRCICSLLQFVIWFDVELLLTRSIKLSCQVRNARYDGAGHTVQNQSDCLVQFIIFPMSKYPAKTKDPLKCVLWHVDGFQSNFIWLTKILHKQIVIGLITFIHHCGFSCSFDKSSYIWTNF